MVSQPSAISKETQKFAVTSGARCQGSHGVPARCEQILPSPASSRDVKAVKPPADPQNEMHSCNTQGPSATQTPPVKRGPAHQDLRNIWQSYHESYRIIDVYAFIKTPQIVRLVQNVQMDSKPQRVTAAGQSTNAFWPAWRKSRNRVCKCYET